MKTITENASYGCLHAWAVLLRNKKAADLIASILEEESAANYKLSELAESKCNATALGEAKDETPPKITTKSASSKKKVSA